MNAWFPVSSCTARCVADPVPPVGRTARAGRLATMTGLVATAPVSRGGARARAERALRALGVAVEVIPPPLPWPSGGPSTGPGRLVVANHVSWVDDVALLALLPEVRPVAKAEVADWPILGASARRTGAVFLDRGRLRSLPASVGEVTGILRAGGSVLVHPEGTTSCGAELGRFRPAFFQAAVDAGAPVCPVALRYRLAGGAGTAVAGYLGGDSLMASLRRIAGTRGLVLEVHQLPALQPGADRRELASMAEYAIAGITEAGPPVARAHPRPVRPPRPSRPVGPAAAPRPASGASAPGAVGR